jgi:hypothetical protein
MPTHLQLLLQGGMPCRSPGPSASGSLHALPGLGKLLGHTLVTKVKGGWGEGGYGSEEGGGGRRTQGGSQLGWEPTAHLQLLRDRRPVSPSFT